MFTRGDARLAASSGRLSLEKALIEALPQACGGGESGNFEDLTYEVYGPHGVAMLVELSTDNRNRTAAEIRSLMTKAGGTIAAAGAVRRRQPSKAATSS